MNAILRATTAWPFLIALIVKWVSVCDKVAPTRLNVSRFALSAAVAGLLVSKTQMKLYRTRLQFAGAIAKWTESSPDLYERSG